ncbi:MAG: DedA family protein [Parachlamydiaceae bacterium]
MEEIFQYICQHAGNAHYIFFGLLMLAGLNVPISEDLLLLMSGAVAGLCLPNEFLTLYAWMFAGCFLSGMEAYWVGRLLGPKLYTLPYFNKVITEKRIATLHTYYEKYGVFTFIVGRFIPCGFRNALFMSSGMGKMPFHIFIARDVVAAFISSAVLYAIGFQAAAHHEELFALSKSYSQIFFAAAVCAIALLWYIRSRIKGQPA